MVKCFSCKLQIPGNWDIKKDINYNNGVYTGLDCYFASQSCNWIYCFCKYCYGNGNFARHIKSFYQAPIQSIINEAAAGPKARIQQLQTTIKTYQDKNKQLQNKLNAAEERYEQLNAKFAHLPKCLPEKSLEILCKLQNYESLIIKELKLQSYDIQTKIRTKITALVEEQKPQFINFYTQLTEKFTTEISVAITIIQQAQNNTLQLLKINKTNSSEAMFDDAEVQRCIKMFQDKIATNNLVLELTEKFKKKLTEQINVISEQLKQ